MTVIRQWSGDGLLPANLTTGSVGTGDTPFTSINNGPFTISASGTRQPRIAWPVSAAAHQVRWNALGNLPAWAVRRYFSFEEMPGAIVGLFFGLNSLGQDLFRISLTTAGFLTLRSGSATVYTATTNPVQANTEYRVEVTGQSDGTATVALYLGDTTTPLTSANVTVTAGNLDEVRFGHHNTMATTGETGDDFAIADEAVFIGPVEEAPTPAIMRKWQGDGLSAGTLTTASAGPGDTPFNAIIGGVTIEENGARSPRIRLSDASQVKRVHWWPLHSQPLTRYAVRWYQTFGGHAPDGITLATGLIGGGGTSWSVRMTSSGTIRLRDDPAETNRWTGGVVLPLNQPVRFELVVDDAMATLSAYRGDTSASLGSRTVRLSSPAIDELRFGATVASSSTGMTYDDLAFHDRAEVIGPVVDGGSGPEPEVFHRWQGDGLAAGALTTSSAGPGDRAFNSVVGDLTIENAGVRAPRIRLPDAAMVKRAHWWPLHPTPLSQYAVRWYQTFGAHPSETIVLAQGMVGGLSNKWSIRLSPDGHLSLRDDEAAVVRWTGESVLPVNQPIRLELIAHDTSATLSAYRGSTAILLSGAAMTLANAAIDELRFGVNTATATSSITYDDIVFHSEAVSHDSIVEEERVYTHFRHNGVEWIPQDVSRV